MNELPHLAEHREFFEKQSLEVRTRGLFLLDEIAAFRRFTEKFGIDMGADFKPVTLEELQRRYVLAVHDYFGGNIMLMRQVLQIHHAKIYKLLRMS